MPKTIGMVMDVLRKARNTGYARKAPYEAVVNNGELILRHYGTMIVQAKDGAIVHLGGYSSSDRDAISTTFEFLGINKNISNSMAAMKDFEKKGIGRNYNGWIVW